MEHIAVIGLGGFGSSLAKSLSRKGHEVLAIDINKEIVEEAKEFCAQALCMDVTDKEALKKLGLEDFNFAFVCIGENMESSVLASLYLKEMKIKHVVAEARTLEHETVLRAIGVDQVIYPERDMAIEIADRLDKEEGLSGEMPLGFGFRIVEIPLPSSVTGKSIGDVKELMKAEELDISVIALKRGRVIRREKGIIPNPQRETSILAGDSLFIIASDEVIDQMGSRENLWK